MTKSEDLIKLTGLCKDVEFIKSEVVEIKSKLEGNYVTKDEFDPIRKIVYGMVSLILVGVVGALLGLVIIK
jgi:hypothetical protein